MLIVFGRVLSLIGGGGFLLLLAGAALSSASGPVVSAQAQSLIGAVTAIACFGAWPLAIFHWGSSDGLAPAARRLWGVGVTFGVFIGAWAYWFFGARPSSRST